MVDFTKITENQIIIILTIITIILAAVSIYVVLYYQKRKRLKFLLDQSLSLVNIKESYKDKIKISYDDIIVDSLTLTQVTIQNSGNSSIQKEDIKVPIKIKFGEGIRIIDDKVISKKPDSLIIHTNKQDDNEINYSFDLFNPGNKIKVQFVCIGEEVKPPKIDASMIADTRYNVISYEEYIEGKTSLKNTIYVGLIILAGLGLIWVTTLNINSVITIYSFVIGTVLFFVGGISMIYFLIRSNLKDFKESYLFLMKKLRNQKT